MTGRNQEGMTLTGSFKLLDYDNGSAKLLITLHVPPITINTLQMEKCFFW